MNSYTLNNRTLITSFCSKHIMFQQENLTGIMCHDAKFKWKQTRGLKNLIRNLVNFHASSWKSENLHFDRQLLSKPYKVLNEKVQRSYLSWHWRVIESLKKNWLLVPKMTQEIWWILMRALESLKICSFVGCFCWKYVMF